MNAGSRGFILCVSLVLAACATDSGTRSRPMAADEGTVLIDNKELAKTLEISRLSMDPGERKTGIANVHIKNLNAQAIQVRARVLFKDEAGISTEITRWSTLSLSPGDKNEFKFSATRPQSVRFMLQLE